VPFPPPLLAPGSRRLGSLRVGLGYKVDRLTRSLADFAKLVELFEAHGVSFVAVTQQFNTTTSTLLASKQRKIAA
jgi:DNA invertase Pin-like site-specific DNA recombinase